MSSRFRRPGTKFIKPKQKAALPIDREVRLPVKQKTAENLLKLNHEVNRLQEELNTTRARIQDQVMPLLTEADLPGGLVVEVTEKAPWEVVLRVPIERQRVPKKEKKEKKPKD